MVLKITRYSRTERSPVVLSRHVRIAISSAAFCERFRDAIATRAGRALRLRFRDTTGPYNFLKADVMQGDEFVTVFVVEVGVSAVQWGIACCRTWISASHSLSHSSFVHIWDNATLFAHIIGSSAGQTTWYSHAIIFTSSGCEFDLLRGSRLPCTCNVRFKCPFLWFPTGEAPSMLYARWCARLTSSRLACMERTFSLSKEVRVWRKALNRDRTWGEEVD